MRKLTVLALLTGSHRAGDAARDPGRRDVIWYERPDHIRLADPGGWRQHVHRQSRRHGCAPSTARHPAPHFRLPIWSPDRSRLLISHVLRFDASGTLLPLRPATVNPDGSGFKLLEPQNARTTGVVSGAGIRTAAGSSAASVAVSRVSSASAPARAMRPRRPPGSAARRRTVNFCAVTRGGSS
jgi:hypothetical protein